MKLSFLGDVIVYATYINHTPNCAVTGMTPYEWLHGHKPSILLGMCYILCMCVCVGASDMTTALDL